MNSFGQLYPIKLKSLTYAAGGDDTVELSKIPKQLFGRLVHLVAIEYAVAMTPTYSTAPTTVGVNNLLTKCDFFDGKMLRFEGGFNHLRAKERMAYGRVAIPDADTDTASGTGRYFRRFCTLGPDNMAGFPTDNVIPAGMLENGELRIKYGALTDISADTTACTATVRVTAWVTLLDEIRIPPAYQFRFQTAGAADVALQGRAAYESIALLNSGSFDAIGAGDFADITLDLGGGSIIPGIQAEDLQAAFLYFRGIGDVGGFMGEPEAASDDNHKIVNRGTPTALVGGAQDLQMVLFSGPGAKLSKLHVAESVAKLAWSGSQPTAVVLTSRFLAQEESQVAANIAAALGKLKAKGSMLPKTLSKRPWTGPLIDFAPWAVKV